MARGFPSVGESIDKMIFRNRLSWAAEDKRLLFISLHQHKSHEKNELYFWQPAFDDHVHDGERRLGFPNLTSRQMVAIARPVYARRNKVYLEVIQEDFYDVLVVRKISCGKIVEEGSELQIK